MRSGGPGRGLHNVPAELTSFVGRRRELAEIKQRLGTSRLVTLTGPGGVGKTRLALRSAAGLERGFRDGVWLVELAGLQAPALVGQAVASALGLRDHSGQWMVGTLRSYLSQRNILLVLDNCEHLLNACAILAGSLLSAGSSLRILATSRQPLGIHGETTIPVPALSLREVDHQVDPSAILPSEAVALFAERGAAVRPDFTVSVENHAAVAQLCRRLDGMPLAIELAAVRLRALSVEEILSRLDNRFELLTGGSRSALPRHQTLRAAIDWSYDSLEPDEQGLLRRLSVFAGGFDLAATEAVCADARIASDKILGVVVGLIEKSLIVREAETPQSRFRMLETIREYAAEKLRAAGEDREFQTRHRRWISDLAGSAHGEWWGPRQADWLARLETEHANLRVALEFCIASSNDTEAGLEIASRLWLYWQARGHLTEARRWLSSLLEQWTAPTASRARALGAAGNLALMQGDIEAATALLTQARELGRATEDNGAVAFGVQYLGLAAIFTGDLKDAVGQLTEALALYQALGNGFGVTNTMGMLARALSILGDSANAIDRWEQSVPMCEQVGDRWVLSYALWNLGVELWIQRRYREATGRQQAALRLKRDLDERLGIALCLEALAWIASSEGHLQQAANLLGASSMMWETLAASLFAAFRSYHEDCERTVRENLGDHGFEDEIRRGKRMALEEAVAYALGEKFERPSKVPTATAAEPVGLLTRREREIAELVAQGLTNKEIAAKLIISDRTVESHILNILNKLGFNSRTQIASWASTHLS